MCINLWHWLTELSWGIQTKDDHLWFRLNPQRRQIYRSILRILDRRTQRRKWWQKDCDLTLIVPGDSLKCSLLLKSEAYPIFLLLYLSSTALTWKSVNLKVVRKFITYPDISKWLSFALKFLILISFSNGLFLQLERIRNSIRLCGQMCIFITNVGINAKFTQKKVM